MSLFNWRCYSILGRVTAIQSNCVLKRQYKNNKK